MKSIFHTSATTAEELRAELVDWLKARAAAEITAHAQRARTNLQERSVLAGKVQLLEEILQFWTEVRIKTV